MEFKKCNRCGCFFTSDENVCCNCKQKDRSDEVTLKSFFEEKETISSLEEVSLNTGISVKNLARYVEEGTYNDIISNLPNTNDNIGNISINL